MCLQVKDRKCVGVRNRRRDSTGGVDLNLLPWQGHFSLFCFLTKRGIFFLPSKDLGLENPVKATAVVSFSPNKGRDPLEADTPFRGRCKMKRVQRNESVLL